MNDDHPKLDCTGHPFLEGYYLAQYPSKIALH